MISVPLLSGLAGLAVAIAIAVVRGIGEFGGGRPVNLAAQPVPFIERIRPHLPPVAQAALRQGSYWVSTTELLQMHQRQAEILAEQERVYRTEIAAVEAHGAGTLARARKKFLASLPPDERGLLATRLRATAEAEARAQFDFTQLRAENDAFCQMIGDLQKDNRRLQRLQHDVRVIRASHDGPSISISTTTFATGTPTDLVAMLIGNAVFGNER